MPIINAMPGMRAAAHVTPPAGMGGRYICAMAVPVACATRSCAASRFVAAFDVLGGTTDAFLATSRDELAGQDPGAVHRAEQVYTSAGWGLMPGGQED